MPASRPLRQPIVASVAYEFESFQHCIDTYSGHVHSHAYSRISNPTVEELEINLARLLGGTEAVGFASGMAALSALLFTIARPGKNIISSPRLYGGTLALFQFLATFGVEVRFVEFHDYAKLETAADQNTVAFFSEPIANPSMSTYDYERVAQISSNQQILCILDNTNTVGLFPALQWADIEVVSATKYIGGQGAAVGGLVIFREIQSKLQRLQQFQAPCPELGGKSPLEYSPTSALPALLRKSTLRNIGSCMSPFNAFIFSLGLDTLMLRMKDISARSRQLAGYLSQHPAVDLVLYPALRENDGIVQRYFPLGAGGLLSFHIRGGREAVETFFKRLRTLPIATNIGDRITIIQHVETTSHSQLSVSESEAAGIVPNLLRVSVGLEPIEQLIDEFAFALSPT